LELCFNQGEPRVKLISLSIELFWVREYRFWPRLSKAECNNFLALALEFGLELCQGSLKLVRIYSKKETKT
jgi:hypothetical protein